MLLAVDIGNSFVTIGFFSGSFLSGKLKIPVRPKKSPRAYRSEIRKFLLPFQPSTQRPEPFTGVILSSVVPDLTSVLLEAVSKLSTGDPLTVRASLNTGLGFDVARPVDIGTDRIANAVAATELLGHPVIAVDFGSATTLTAVKNGAIIGGAILPGMSLLAQVLHDGTAQLPALDISLYRTSREGRPRAVGKDTPRCMVSGIIYGTAGAVEMLVSEMEREEDCNFGIVITGGYAGMMASFLRRGCSVEPDLTLNGLRLIYERNT